MALVDHKSGAAAVDPDDHNAVVDAVIALQDAGGSQPITSPLGIDDCALWLDASTLALANNAPVALWPDGSTSGFDAAQATADNKPVCKTAVLNGLRAVRFDPGSFIQYLALSGAGLDLFRDVAGATVAIVAWSVTSDDYTFEAADSTNSGVQRFALEALTNGGVNLIGGNTDPSNGDFTAEGIGGAAWCVGVGAIDFEHGSLAAETSVGTTKAGAANGTPGRTPDTASAAITVGATPDVNAGMDGYIAEVAVWPRALTASERRQVLEYLSAKWALP